MMDRDQPPIRFIVGSRKGQFWVHFSLFSLYINDLNNALKLDSILFADDTNLFIWHTDPDFLIDTLNCELEKLLNWFRGNRLSLNLTKTNFMEFKPRQKKYSSNFSVVINERTVAQVNGWGIPK